MIDLTISIVTFNSENFIKNCINSIIENTKEISTEIIVVDNRSEDGTSKIIKTYFPNVTLIENRENVGFGRAHNQSFKISKGRYFLVLNPDTIIFPDTLNKMVKFMDENRNVGASGCKIFWDKENNFMFPDLKIHSLKTAIFQFTPFCRFFPNSMFSRWYWKSANILWDSDKPINVEGVTGGLIMLRREAFEAVGLFDENFFLFFEEHDLLRRIKKKGWEIYYLPEPKILHYFEESVRNSPIDINTVYNKSALYYYEKHYKKFGYHFIKLLFKINKFLNKIDNYLKISYIHKNLQHKYPEDGEFIIKWHKEEHVKKYLLEISYSPEFAERGGMYTATNILSIKSDILKKLPNKTGFIRITPIYNGNKTGKILKIIKISRIG